jgi:phosphoglycerate kinase
VITGRELSAAAVTRICGVDAIAPDEMAFDYGPESVRLLLGELATCKTVLWNGPLGVFEIEAFAGGTRSLAQAIAGSAAFSIAGGGDTVAAINAFDVADRIGYVSTAGGAFLEFLEGKTLPAVRALQERARESHSFS